MDRLETAGGTSARAFVESLELTGEPAGRRPRVVAVMIASVDGRATVEGRSVQLGHPEDRALLRELRTGADAVLSGSATLRAERYANLLDPDQRAYRRAAGRPEHPVVATVSRSLDLRADEVPLLREEDVEVVVYSEQAGEVEGAAPGIAVRAVGAPLRLEAVLEDLGARGIRSVVCEGGPALLRRLLAAGLVDDLLLTVAPLLVAGDGPTSLTGDALSPPVAFGLRAVHRAEDHLFLHYAAR